MFLTTDPAAMSTAASGLRAIGSTMVAGNAAAAAPTTGVLPPSLDEVGALLAAQFGTHGGVYQAVSGIATAMHEMFVSTMGVSAGSYAVTEAANVAASM